METETLSTKDRSGVDGISELLVLVHPGSVACRDLMKEMEAVVSHIHSLIKVCDVSGQKARRLLTNNSVVKIEGAPVLLVVKTDGEGEVFLGRSKIIQWMIETEERMNEEDPMIGIPEPPVQEQPQLEFAFADDKKGGRRHMEHKNQAANKYNDVKSLARKMQDDRSRTYGYDDTPNQTKMNAALMGGGAEAEPVVV
jgi:hypothetical protein